MDDKLPAAVRRHVEALNTFICPPDVAARLHELRSKGSAEGLSTGDRRELRNLVADCRSRHAQIARALGPRPPTDNLTLELLRLLLDPVTHF